MLEVNFDLATVRIFLHVMAVTVWVGGQIVMMALVPVMKAAGVDGLPAKAANAFNAIAWPAMAIAIFTGIWNILALNSVEKSFAWSMTFGIKFLFVIFSGAGALLHQKADDPKKKGMFAGIGFLCAIIATFLGVAL